MTNVPLGASSWRRGVSGEPDIALYNRYFETNPTNLTTQAALLSRPGLRKYLTVGEGPIRAIYSQPGSFNDALFVVSGTELYRVDTDETITLLDSAIASGGDAPSMAATASIDAVPAYLYIADGTNLKLYDGTTVTTLSTPEGVPIRAVATIASYVICVVAPGANFNGRFYWIDPGETTIDALDFATAERSPDPVLSVRVVGDQFWLLGENSTEVWYPTGDADTPFAKTQGRVFDRGVWGGTDVAVKDSVMVVDTDGVVYQIVDGAPRRVSNHAVEERIRQAIKDQITG